MTNWQCKRQDHRCTTLFSQSEYYILLAFFWFLNMYATGVLALFGWHLSSLELFFGTIILILVVGVFEFGTHQQWHITKFLNGLRNIFSFLSFFRWSFVHWYSSLFPCAAVGNRIWPLVIRRYIQDVQLGQHYSSHQEIYRLFSAWSDDQWDYGMESLDHFLLFAFQLSA